MEEVNHPVLRGWVSLTPGQASRISQEASKTGAAVGVTQDGNVVTIDTGRQTVRVNAGGFDIPSSSQETLC